MNINHPPSESNIKEWQYHGLIKLLLDSLPSKNQKKKHLRVIEKSKSYESAYEKCMSLIEEYNDYKTKARKENRRVKMYVPPANTKEITKYLPREMIVEPYVPKHFDIESIKKYCWASKEAFEKIYRSYSDMVCDTVVTTNGLKYIYWSRPGSTLLFVAHLDFVCGGQTYSQKGNKFYLQNLDDRLGAYLICAGLPHLLKEVKFDVLFTDGEETGRSTAKFFSKEKCKNSYNWLAEFDRRGDDVVMYSYETPEMRKLLVDNGFKVGIGSYTDIASLDDLGVKGFNFGIGYQANHSTDAYFEGDVLDKQMELMAAFINKYHTTKFSHEKKTYSYTTTTYSSYGGVWSNGNTRKNATYTTTKTDKGIVPGKIYVLSGNRFVEKTKCKICDSLSCKGISTCSACKIDFHNSLILQKFGMCSFCLVDLYGINNIVLDLIREWSFNTNGQVEDIDGLVYDKKDIDKYILEIKGIINDTNKSNQ